MDISKIIPTVLHWLRSPAQTITGAIFWSLATIATSFIAAVGAVFVTSVRADASITALVKQAAYAVAVVFAVSIPILALMGAIFLACLMGRAFYRLFKRGERHKSQYKKPIGDAPGTVIPFEQRKKSAS